MSDTDLKTRLNSLVAPPMAAGLDARILAALPATQSSNDRWMRYARYAALALVCAGALALGDAAMGPSEGDMWQHAAVDSGFGDVYAWTGGR